MTTLETPVPLLQHPDEFTQLLDLYRTHAPTRVLEVGTYHGGTLYHWLHNATPGATIVSIDNYATGIDNTSLFAEWATPTVELVLIRGDSNDPDTATAAAAHGPYDWIYIDADHHLPNVRRDWELYNPLAATDALIVFHDISPSVDPSLQVAPLWHELRDQHETLEFTAEHGWGIGVIFT